MSAIDPMSMLAQMAPGSGESAGNPMEALQAAAGIGQAMNAILSELKAGRERTDALIEATHRQTAALEAIAVTISEVAEKFGQGGMVGTLRALAGRG